MSEKTKNPNSSNRLKRVTGLLAASAGLAYLAPACSNDDRAVTKPVSTVTVAESRTQPESEQAKLYDLLKQTEVNAIESKQTSEANQRTNLLLAKFIKGAETAGLTSLDQYGRLTYGTVNGYGEAAKPTQTTCSVTELEPDSNGQPGVRVDVSSVDFTGQAPENTTNMVIVSQPQSLEINFYGPYTGDEGYSQKLDDSFGPYLNTAKYINNLLISELLPGILADDGCLGATELNPLVYTNATANDPVRGVSSD